eukprot:1700507-Rhodomonas_salina.1
MVLHAPIRGTELLAHADPSRAGAPPQAVAHRTQRPQTQVRASIYGGDAAANGGETAVYGGGGPVNGCASVGYAVCAYCASAYYPSRGTERGCGRSNILLNSQGVAKITDLGSRAPLSPTPSAYDNPAIPYA